MQFVIIQHNKSIEFVDEKTAMLITEGKVQGAKGMKRKDGVGWLDFSAVADIKSVEDYYTQNPDKRPYTAEESSENKEYYKPIEFYASQRQESFKQRLRGLKDFIDKEIANGVKPIHAMALYATQLEKYKILFAKAEKVLI